MAAKNLKFKQFLYKYPANADPNFILGEDLCEKIAKEKGLKKVIISSVGIQAPRGTRFFINGDAAIVGSTGRFELNNVILITSLKIGTPEDATFYSNIIVDILYYEGV